MIGKRKFCLDRTQATILFPGLYFICSLIGNVAATKVIHFGSLVMDAGLIYGLTFTIRDLIHKQLGKRAALTTIYMCAAFNLIAALYFQFVVILPPESSWAASGGQTAWTFLFSLQLRVVIGSIITQVIAELVDTFAYQIWTNGFGRNKPQWLRVIVSNGVAIPIDSILFTAIAFAGVLDADGMARMIVTTFVTKWIMTILSFWSIYLVPEKPIYYPDSPREDQGSI